MRRPSRWTGRWAAMVLVAGLLLSACGGARPTPLVPQESVRGPAGPSSSPSPEASGPLTEVFPYDRFSNPTTITNAYLPLKPGTYWKWDGVTVEDGEETSHQIITMITDMTKVIDGVETVVGYDEDWSDGQLVEAEIFFAAQDDDGAVWRLGEYPEEYEDGKVIDNPAWIAGVEEALAGIMMRAQPVEGERSYAQGWGPAVEWADRGRVIEASLDDCVAIGCFDRVILVEEWDIAEPLARQLKYHAPEVGVIRVDWSGSGDQSQEALQLVEFRTLDPAELSVLRTKALAMEASAYETLEEVYGATEPMTQRS